MKKIIFLLITAMLLSMTVTVNAYEGLELIAEYDMKDSQNKVNANLYPLSSESFIKINDYEYEDVYRIYGGTNDLSEAGNSYAKGWIDEIEKELDGAFVFDAWAYSVGKGYQAVFSIGDSSQKLNYKVFRVCNGYLQFDDLYRKDNGDGTYQDTKVVYKNTDLRNIGTGWHHFVIAYTPGADIQTVYVNENKYTLSCETDMTALPEGSEVAEFTDNVKFIYNCAANPSNNSRFRFSDMKIYKGSATEENLEKMAAEGNFKYESAYNVTLYQDGAIVKKDKLSELTEAKAVTAKIAEVAAADVTEETVYFENPETKETVKGKINIVSDTQAEIEFCAPVGTYNFVIKASVGNKNGQRKTDYVLPIEIKEDLEFKAAVRAELKTGAEGLEGVLRKYEYYLGLDFSVYESCVGKNSVLSRMAQYISENEEFEFSDIAPKFKELCDEQSILDYKDGILSLNAELNKPELDIATIEDIIFNTYGASFSISDEEKTAYGEISDKALVWEALKGKTYSEDIDTVNETIQTVKQDINNSILMIKRNEFFVLLDNASEEELEQMLKTAVIDYGLAFDLENEDYVNHKESVIKLLSETDISADNLIEKINRIILAENLNAVEVGDRGRVEELINAYGKFAALPEEYTKADNKSSYHKKMIGKVYTEATIETVMQQAVLEAGDLEEESYYQSTGRSSGGKTGSVSVVSSTPVVITKTEPTEEIRPANEEKAVFSDLTEFAWATEAIETLYKKGIVNGVGDGLFDPKKAIVREEAVKLIVEAFELKGDGAEIEFLDVKPEFWALDYIKRGMENGIIMGISDTEFGTGIQIKREDFAVIINRVTEKLELVLEEGQAKEFTDKENISDYATEAVERLGRLGIINGDEVGGFKPKASLTRAEAAQMIYNLLKVMEVEAE